jgi:cell division transport system ATP-binding protein
VIALQNVTKIYPASTRPALDGVTLDIDKGEFVFLIGASGSGKSSVLRLLLREDAPTKGNVIVNGKDIAKLPGRKIPELRRGIGCVFQDFRLLPKKTSPPETWTPTPARASWACSNGSTARAPLS